MDLRDALRATQAGQTLDRDEARAVFAGALNGDTDPVLFGGFLAALATRGETADEIAGAASALRGAALPFEHDAPDAVDTCGTGGDGLSTFNLSSAAAIVAAAGGATVIKHGNRSVSSSCGSADLLEAAGVELDLAPADARAVLEEVGITFLFAPRYHPAMRFAGPVRRSLGVRTIFNFLGPLANPGAVRRQLLGVSDDSRLDDFAAALSGLGCERGYVVHGAGGADELTLAGPNRVRAVGDAPEERFDGEHLGLAPAPVEALAGGDAQQNLALLGRLLEGQPGPLRDALVLNAGAALVAAGVAQGAADGVGRAAAAIDSGEARRRLADWVAATRGIGG